MRDKGAQVAVRGQEEDGVKLLANTEGAPEAEPKEGQGDEEAGRLEEPGGEAATVDGHKGGAKVPALGRCVVLVHEAGQEAVPAASYALLVQGEEGHKPGDLKNEQI